MEQHTHDFFLTAAECGPQRTMALDKLVELVIDVATEHANKLGVGFDALISQGVAWVLSRLAMEFDTPLELGHSYRMETWVESLNRMFSERNFAFVSCQDKKVIGYARTTWMVVDMETRRPGDLSKWTALRQAINPRECPIEKCGKMSVTTPDEIIKYDIRASDIDINRHMTTRRYIDFLVNAWPLDFWDKHRLGRLEMAFKREARYGREVSTARQGETVEISSDEGLCALAKITFAER